ncbi:MAG: hypothetical protein KDB21_03055 [Acidimicrobiales bacterium]|nr:hypothetical protein [Acidimicrobiales bacterium]
MQRRTAMCTTCGVVAPAERIGGGAQRCDHCRHRRSYERSRRLGLIWLALALLGVVAWTVPIGEEIGPLWKVVRFYGVLAAVYPFAVLAHELGHVIATVSTGGCVHRLVLGSGAPILRMGRRGVLVVNSYPASGATYLSSAGDRWWRIREAISIAGGPAVDLAVLVGALVWSPEGSFPGTVRGTLILIAASSLIAGLIPREAAHPETGMPYGNDGMLLARLGRRCEATHKDAATSRAWLALVDEDNERARREAEAAIAAHPHSPAAQLVLATAQILTDDATLALPALRALASAPTISGHDLAATLNNLAFAVVVAGDPTLLPEAEDASRRALASLPTSSATIGTRAQVLIEVGSLDEARPLVDIIGRRAQTPNERARWLALASIWNSAAGHADAAEGVLALAIDLDPDELLVGVARRTVRNRDSAVG